MKTQLRALTCLSASMWGLPLVQARMVYGMMIRPAMTYGALTWHQPQGDGVNQDFARALAPFHNQCLRTMTSPYRAAPISTPEAEACVPPIKPIPGFHGCPGHPTPGEQWDGSQD